MTDDLIDRAKAALEGVTPGPWETDNNDGYSIWRLFSGAHGLLAIAEVFGDSAEADADARFIAAARQLVPDLIAALEARDARIAELEDAISGRTFSVDEGREWKARADAAEARVKVLEDESERLRLAVKLAKSTADEWAISRSTGNPALEGEKADALWKAMRRLSALADGPIRARAALEGEKT